MNSTSPTAGLPPCIVLAGGLGTRLRSVVDDRPKCLAPVGASTFLELQLKLLARRGVSRFVLSLGYMAEAVTAAVSPLRDRFRIDWVVEPQSLGTGGGVLHTMAEARLDEALVTNGDTWLDADLSRFAAELDLAGRELMRMAVIEVPDRSRYGGPTMDAGGVVRGFLAKGAVGPGLINGGFYRLHRAVFQECAAGTSFSLESTVMPRLAEEGSLRAVAVAGDFIDIGVPEDYERFRRRHA